MTLSRLGEVPVFLMCRNQRVKENEETMKYIQTKKNKTSETNLNETGVHDLLDKDFKIIVIKCSLSQENNA